MSSEVPLEKYDGVTEIRLVVTVADVGVGLDILT